MSETMTAIAIEGGKGAADALRPETVARPKPGPARS
jgi:NADPH2:quinone reductase